MTLELTVDEEIRLLQFRPEDAPALFTLIDRNRAHLSQHGDDTSQKYPTLASVQESIALPKNPNRTRLGIWLNNDLVGSINITQDGTRAEIGYYLDEVTQGRGIMTRSVQRIIRYGFDELQCTALFAKVAVSNIASQAVLYRAGFRLTKNNEHTAHYVLMKS